MTFLAGGTVERTPFRGEATQSTSTAARTRRTHFLVHRMPLLVSSTRAIGSTKIADCRTVAGDRVPKNGVHGRKEPIDRGGRKSTASGVWMNSSLEQNFIGVDIAETCQLSLVEEQGLEPTS